MIRKSVKQSDQQRVGATVVEFVTAGALLATVMTFLVPFLAKLTTANESVTDREHVLRELQNLVVEMQLGEQSPQLSEALINRLDSPKLNVQRDPEAVESMTQITLSITWKSRVGEPHPPISLTFWQPLGEGT